MSLRFKRLVSRRLNPFDMGVITIGSFDGKGQFNVIKDSIELEGDVRYMTEEVQQLIDKEIHRIVNGIEAGIWCVMQARVHSGLSATLQRS